MNSKILGKVLFDEQLLQEEITKILQFEFSDVYSDYAIGEWKVCILWNQTGFYRDSLLREYEGRAQPTELGKELSYLNTVIKNIFNTEHIKWVRLFLLRKGLVVPHTDYVELESGFLRVHVPLQTNLNCLNSNGDMVYHMRKGEIWFLDASQPHSGCNFSDTARLSLCIDFIPYISFIEIFQDKKQYDTSLVSHIVERPPINEDYMKGLQSLGYLIGKENFDDIISLMAKVHFVRNANAALMFDWLIDITQRSGNKELLDKALAMKRFYIDKRSLGEVLAV
jgi:putative nonproteinogenic amino acid hydroxylase